MSILYFNKSGGKIVEKKTGSGRLPVFCLLTPSKVNMYSLGVPAIIERLWWVQEKIKLVIPRVILRFVLKLLVAQPSNILICISYTSLPTLGIISFSKSLLTDSDGSYSSDVYLEGKSIENHRVKQIGSYIARIKCF